MGRMEGKACKLLVRYQKIIKNILVLEQIWRLRKDCLKTTNLQGNNKCPLRNEKQNEKTITTITMCAFDWVGAG